MELNLLAEPKSGGEAKKVPLTILYSALDIIDRQKSLLVHKGFLKKQGGSRGGNKSWLRRWFELEQNALSYYVDPKTMVLKGVVKLDNLIECEVLLVKHDISHRIIPFNDQHGLY